MPKEELQGRAQPPFLSHRDSPVWTRQYSNNKEQDCSCETLAEALSALPGAQRMIVGHTIQVKIAPVVRPVHRAPCIVRLP